MTREDALAIAGFADAVYTDDGRRVEHPLEYCERLWKGLPKRGEPDDRLARAYYDDETLPEV